MFVSREGGLRRCQRDTVVLGGKSAGKMGKRQEADSLGERGVMAEG